MSAELVRRAFQHAENECNAGNVTQWGYWNAIEEYLDTFAPDRRYKLQCLAASHPISSAIVRYRGVGYYLEGVYNTETQSRDYTIIRTN